MENKNKADWEKEVRDKIDGIAGYEHGVADEVINIFKKELEKAEERGYQNAIKEMTTVMDNSMKNHPKFKFQKK